MLSLLRYFALNNYKYNRIKLPLMCSRMQKEYPHLLRPPPTSRSKDWPPVADTFIQR